MTIATRFAVRDEQPIQSRNDHLAGPGERDERLDDLEFDDLEDDDDWVEDEDWDEEDDEDEEVEWGEEDLEEEPIE